MYIFFGFFLPPYALLLVYLAVYCCCIVHVYYVRLFIIIQSKFFFLFIGREPTTWPVNNCLQIMVCSCAMPSNCVWLQIIFWTCLKETVLFSFLWSLLRENGRSLCLPRIFIKQQTRWSNDKTIIELRYCKILWFVSVSQINYSIIDLLAQTNHDILLNLVQ